MIMEQQEKYWVIHHEGIQKKTRDIFNEYLLCLKIENEAEATISKYRILLEKFLIDCNVPLNELTSEDVFTWLYEFSMDKKPWTIELMLSALSSMFTFCLEEGYMESVVIKNPWRPIILHSIPQFLNEQEYAYVKLKSEELSKRARLIILFSLSSGCRISELSGLTLKDVNLN